ALLRNQPALCTKGDQVRDYLHARDAGEALARLVEGNVQGPVNVASGVPVSVADIVQAFARAFGRPDLVRLGAVPTPAGEPPYIVARVSRLADEVGWRPRYDLESGIRDAVAW